MYRITASDGYTRAPVALQGGSQCAHNVAVLWLRALAGPRSTARARLAVKRLG